MTQSAACAISAPSQGQQPTVDRWPAAGAAPRSLWDVAWAAMFRLATGRAPLAGGVEGPTGDVYAWGMPTSLRTASDLVRDARLVDVSEPAADGVTLVARLDGEINLHNSPAVRADLLRLVDEHKPRRLVLNLQTVPYMDSSAIAVLVEVLKRLRGDGGRVYLTSLQKRVAGLLQIARLDSIFDLRDTDEVALGEV